ncbi:hypothetical protein N5C66_22575 [Rhizobium pusense]|uniref:hypothetical protein n=1 Tax=Agrobacterium pusense TaxID=648995 RepID=UPI000D1A462A|nr:hypothetical protein [Agrobacterium pusense]MDH0910477.1 hypothetical protein [Agrobacterium pusense]MDH1098408.1 hypothetical protein [Agrobacterium pusense]MDH1114518.1 hypothetical protein [Agrobacterium pusense]MDH2195718.1 hypothetical protein [Agrobacterium pusense]
MTDEEWALIFLMICDCAAFGLSIPDKSHCVMCRRHTVLLNCPAEKETFGIKAINTEIEEAFDLEIPEAVVKIRARW